MSRLKLETIKQVPTESVQNFNLRFSQQFNELNYAIQNDHSNSTARRLALQTEEKSAIKKYIMNLKEEIGTQIRPLKPTTLNQYLKRKNNRRLYLRKRFCRTTLISYLTYFGEKNRIFSILKIKT